MRYCPLCRLPPFAASAALLLVVLLSLVGPAVAGKDSGDKDYNETINGTRLHFRVRGEDKDAPYLLILPGDPGVSAHLFYPWCRAEDVEGWFNIVYLDQRGSGQSERLKIANPAAPKPEEVQGYTFAALIADIEAVRQRLKVPKWYVLCHSGGALLGLEYVTAHPERVIGFIDMAGLIAQPAAQDAAFDFARDWYDRQSKAAADAAVQQQSAAKRDAVAAARTLLPGPERLAAESQLLLSDTALFQALYYANPAQGKMYRAEVGAALQYYKISPEVLYAPEPQAALAVTERYASRDDTPLLAKVSVPTLILNGEEDRLITPAQARQIHDKIPGSSLVLLENCGHRPFADQPEKTKAALLVFLQSIGTSIEN